MTITLMERFGICLLVVSVASVVLSSQIIDRKTRVKIPRFEAYAGGDICLPCGGDVSWKLLDAVTWLKQKDNETIKLARKELGIVINLGPRRYEFIGPEDLFIPKLTDNDKGLYSCQIGKNNGEVLSTTFVTLDVKVLCMVPNLSPHMKSVNCQSLEAVLKNHICTFRCEPGYTLIGSHEVVCLSNGLFSSPMPGCYDIPTLQAYAGHDAFLACIILADLNEDDILYWKQRNATTYTTLLAKTNGKTTTWGDRGVSVINKTVLLIPTVTKEDNAIYQCKLVKKSIVHVYSWNITLEVIEKCSWPTLSSELQLHPRSCEEDVINEGDKCSFQCKKGYQITRNTTVSCLPDGRFSAPIPSCQAVNCTIGKLGSHMFSELGRCQEYGSVPFGTSCYFSCSLNYRLWNGDAVRACQANATLSGRAGLCKETNTLIILIIGAVVLSLVVASIMFIVLRKWVRQRRSQHPTRVSTQEQ